MTKRISMRAKTWSVEGKDLDIYELSLFLLMQKLFLFTKKHFDEQTHADNHFRNLQIKSRGSSI